MHLKSRFIEELVDGFEGNYPELRDCRKYFLERIEEVMFDNYPHNFKEEKLEELIKENTVQVRKLGKDAHLDHIFEYLARQIGYSQLYLLWVFDNKKEEDPFSYFKKRLDEIGKSINC